MKKILVMLLVASMCVSLVACGGEKDSSTSDNSMNQDNNDNVTSNSDSESEVDYAKIISEESSYWLKFRGYDSGIIFCEDNSYINATMGSELGTWEIDDTTLTIISEDNNSTCYEIKEINGVCFLVGDSETLYNANLDESEFPIKEVEITIDNWQEYFEISTCTVENVDAFGEVTETSECLLKLKDDYYKYLIKHCGGINSEIALRYTTNSSSDSGDTRMDITGDLSAFGAHWKECFELVEIQGTLYFIDIE